MNFDRASVINSPLSINKELQFLFERISPLTIFDIGACEGESSIQYARLFPNSKIYAFEPLPGNIELIRHNFQKYNIHNASFYNIALSSKNGKADFYVSSGKPDDVIESDWDFGNKSSSLLAPDKHLKKFGFIHFDKEIEVETITIETFCNSNNIDSIDFIHMDVQGAELMVLEGAGKFITSIKSIWLEVSTINYYKDQPLENDVKLFMAKNNFILLKNELNGEQGDQLYVSKNFYPSYKLLFLARFISLKKKAGSFLQKIKW